MPEVLAICILLGMAQRFNPDTYHRRSIRLRGYDYAQAGAYFVTICTQGRACFFGEVVNGEMRLNDAGWVVTRWWTELVHAFAAVETDAYVVMPNHMHGIIVIHADHHLVGADLRVGPDRARRVGPHAHKGAHKGAPLHQIVQWFKTMTTNEYIRGVKTLGWLPFDGKLWQRNYYEHIIRDDADLARIRAYIAANPLRWKEDRLHPDTPAKWS